MSALAELRKRAGTAANPANPANQGQPMAVDSQDSQDSQGVRAGKRMAAVSGSARPGEFLESLKEERTRLLVLAAAAQIDPHHVHRMLDPDLADYAGLSDAQLTICLHWLADTADRNAGRVPAGDTAAMHCIHCGPVYIHPDIAAVLPVVGGWPRALGCPWCFISKAGGYIPRPPVTCSDCAHYKPDTVNPEAGMGTCGAGKGTHYPMARHLCADIHPNKVPTP